MSATPSSLQWSMNWFSEGMLVCVNWNDSDEYKQVCGSKWSNGEIKIFKDKDYYDFRSEMWRKIDFFDCAESEINASYTHTNSEGITIRMQVNPDYLQIGFVMEVVDVDSVFA